MIGGRSDVLDQVEQEKDYPVDSRRISDRSIISAVLAIAVALVIALLVLAYRKKEKSVALIYLQIM